MTADNRVVLPLDRVRQTAATFCRLACLPAGAHRAEPVHDDHCLAPLLAERDRLLDEIYAQTRISGDCLDPVKHGACSGCGCTCHTKRRPT